jgi:hypothetical protein
MHAYFSDRPSRPWYLEYRRNHRGNLPFHSTSARLTRLRRLIEMAEARGDLSKVLAPICNSNEYELKSAVRFAPVSRSRPVISAPAGISRISSANARRPPVFSAVAYWTL